MNPQLTKPQWCSIPQDIRIKLREIFNIKRSESCEVCGNQLISDGTSHQDLQAISIESMQQYLGSQEDDFKKLFDLVMEKIDPKPLPEIPEEQIEVLPEPVEVPQETPTIIPELQAVIDAAAPKPKKPKGCPKGGWPKKEPAPIPDDVKEILEKRSLNANQNEDVKTQEASAE